MTHIRMLLKHLCLALKNLKEFDYKANYAPIIMFYVDNFDIKAAYSATMNIFRKILLSF